MHWRRKRQPTPVFLPGESQGRGSLMGCRLWGRTESDTTEATQQQQQQQTWTCQVCSQPSSWQLSCPGFPLCLRGSVGEVSPRWGRSKAVQNCLKEGGRRPFCWSPSLRPPRKQCPWVLTHLGGTCLRIAVAWAAVFTLERPQSSIAGPRGQQSCASRMPTGSTV